MEFIVYIIIIKQYINCIIIKLNLYKDNYFNYNLPN